MIFIYVEFDGGWKGIRCNHLVDVMKIIKRARYYTVGNVVEDKIRYVFIDVDGFKFGISIDVDEKFIIEDVIDKYIIDEWKE
jgi:hypothetical protein